MPSFHSSPRFFGRAALVAAVIGLAACGGGSTATKNDSATIPSVAPASADSTAMTSAADTTAVTASATTTAPATATTVAATTAAAAPTPSTVAGQALAGATTDTVVDAATSKAISDADSLLSANDSDLTQASTNAARGD